MAAESIAASYFVGSHHQVSEDADVARKVRNNRGQFCCCLLRLAKRISSSGWRAIFGSGGDGLQGGTSANAGVAGSPGQAGGAETGGVAGQQQLLHQPPPPRGPSGLVGLENQGATCYLNSLVQVIAASPELRRAIFAVSPEQLGLDEHGFPAGGDLRRIPYELQRLLARVLLADSAYLSTRELTESFGWRGRESGDQHDVQELSRLLMNAMEESLVDTGAYQPIKAAVAGCFVTGVECLSCGYVSSQSEEFLDICLATVGFSSVESSLQASYGVEKLEGSNQYRCDKCNRMVDAKKFCRLERLPPILTLSLMRFNYDRDRMQRVKNGDKFSFPMQLDMRPHMSDTAVANAGVSQFQYELYAVIAHWGSAMGGHYRAFVLDLEGRGFPAGIPSQQTLLALANQSGEAQANGNSDPPLHLEVTKAAKLQHQRSASGASSLGRLKQQQQQQQQRQWFAFSDTQVRLVPEVAVKEQFAGQECAYMLFYRRIRGAAHQPTSATPSRLTEDAVRSEIPGWLYKSIMAENESIRQRREELETAANTVCFDVFAEAAFRLTEDRFIWELLPAAARGVNVSDAEMEMVSWHQPVAKVSIDCRLPVAELLRRVGHLMNGRMDCVASVLVLEQTQSGFYCLAKLSDVLPNSFVPIKSTYLTGAPNSSVVLLCFSSPPDKNLIHGDEHRPVRLTFRVFNQAALELRQSRSTTLLSCLRLALEPHMTTSAAPEAAETSTMTRKRFKAELERSVVFHRKASVFAPLTKSDEIPREKFKRSLLELGLRDGDTLIVRSNVDLPIAGVSTGNQMAVSNGMGNGAGGSKVAAIVDVIICLTEDETQTTTYAIELAADATIGDLKAIAVSLLQGEGGSGTSADRPDTKDYRLLIYNDMLQCYCPEYEATLYRLLRVNGRAARLQKQPAFWDNQIFVRVHLPTTGRVGGYVVNRDLQVGELRRLAVAELVGAGSADRYHLCFYSTTANRPLDEIKEGASLAHSNVRHRSCLCLKAGSPILTGQLRFQIYERLPFDSDWLAALTNQPARLFAHHLTLSLGEWSNLDAIREALGDSDEAPLRLYSYRPDESRLGSVLHHETVVVRRLSEPGWAICYERLDRNSPGSSLNRAPPLPGSQILLWLTVKSTANGNYPVPEAFWWDLTADGDGASALYRQVAQRLGWPVGELRLAKRLHHACVWRPLPANAVSLRRGVGYQEGGSSGAGSGEELLVLREFDVLGCMRAAAQGGSGVSSGLDRFESPEDERLLRERGGAPSPSGGTVTPGWSGDVVERGLVICVPKYAGSNARSDAMAAEDASTGL